MSDATSESIEVRLVMPRAVFEELKLRWQVECGAEAIRACIYTWLHNARFPRENADTKGHGSGEQEAQAPIGPRPSQETEPLGGARESLSEQFARAVGMPWWAAIILALLIGELLGKLAAQWTKAVFGL